ncbi:SNF2 family N-terminal domain [Teratosphaeria destructans]|uniref:SNF2 family N-terminal domain n=1 Tax=Teratosphaeria destructans TaxID=418781 RepID=A0A9W7W2N8_9PEZI|nr:SNF2 family N-terminal domain [Teratosphaeria destructans]
MADSDDTTLRESSHFTVKEESTKTPAPNHASAPINVDTDDEDDDGDGPSSMAPPITPARHRPTPGLFITGDTPAPTATPVPTLPSTPGPGFEDDLDDDTNIQERMLAVQRTMARRYQERSAQSTPPRQQSQIPNSYDLMPSPPAAPHRGNRGGKDEAAAKFQKAEAAYQRKVNAGTASVQDEIRFIKLDSEEKARLRKLEADEDYERTPSVCSDDAGGSESLFISGGGAPQFSAMFSDEEQEPAPSKKRKRSTRADDDGDDPQERPKKRGRPKKTGEKVAATSFTQEDLDRVLNALDKGKKAPAKTGRVRKAAPVMTNLGSIMGTDVFGDAAANRHLPSQPTDFGITQRGKIGTRNDALKSLIASVPLESKDSAQSDKNYLDDAIKQFSGWATCRPAPDGNWSVKGMKSTLKHYQILGVAFMRKRENAGEEPRGGILGDQMGLGKTIMMLCNIVNGRAKPNSKHTATLIVASPALISQWYSEILQHCQTRREHKQYGLGHVILYKSGSRILSNHVIESLEQADVVLTTYYEIAKSYPKAVVPTNLVTPGQKDAWWKQHYDENRGVFHRAKFHRIVLDEAQAIKNHRGHTSMACRAVEAKYHWAITGTPILNTVKELYPYFKFLKEPYTGSYAIWKANFASSDDPDGSTKLAVFLSKFLLRRTHVSTLFNARLLDLPQPTEHTVWLEFNAIERQIYEIIKKRFVQRINSISQGSRDLDKQYSHIWTMILRLRQLCSSLLLVQDTLADLLEVEDFEKLHRITEESEETTIDEGASLLVHLRTILSAKNKAGVKVVEGGLQGAVITEAETIPMGVIDAGEPDIDTGGLHGVSFRFRKYLESLLRSKAWDEIKSRTVCCGCRQRPSDPIVTSCFHVFCKSCITDIQHLAARRGHDTARCTECGEAYTSAQPCIDLDSFQRSQSTHVTPEAVAGGNAAKKGKKSKSREKASGMESWLTLSGDVLPSAKTQAVKAQVLNWLEEDAEAKIIIYTQFIPMVSILARICSGEQWGFVKYTGEMSHEARAKAITEFGQPDVKIMLASLKCGGLGLNLTMASRVICVDAWWNNAIEQQAFCRVYRIGQVKETRMTRFVIKNSIDAAMMALKERKQIEIDEVMNDAQKVDKLTVNDLMSLFGKVAEDENGKAFIFADVDETNTEEHLRLPDVDEEDENHFLGNEE